jgi:hypothetical protein
VHNVFIQSTFSSTEEGLVLVSKPSATGPAFKRSVSSKELASKILRSVPESQGFHFYLEIGKPTGQTAVSLTDLVEKLKTVDAQSINFHYSRKDFQKWIREVFGDAELALRLGRIGRVRLGISGEALRSEIMRAVKLRLNEFKATLQSNL